MAQQKTAVTVRLSWYGKHSLLNVGDEWQLQVRLRPPHGLQNPGGFDYSRWLFEQGVRATGYVINKRSQRFIQKHPWHYPITQFRQHIEHVITQIIHDPSIVAMVSALSVGSRTYMTQDEWQVLQATGTNHLVAISGLHIGLIATAAYFIMHKLWCCFPRLLLCFPAPKVASIAAIIVSIVYSLIAGFSLPTQRAVIMIVVLMVGSLAYRDTPMWRRLLFALLLIIINDPFALSSASFWLSFAAVSFVAYGMGGRSTSNKSIWKWVRLQWVISVGVMPFTLFFFQCMSWVILLANAVAIPWVGFLIVPLSLLACLSYLINVKLSESLFYLVGKLTVPLWWWLHELARFPMVVWAHGIANKWVLLSAVVGALLLLVPKGLSLRWLGIIWLLPMIYYRPPHPPPNAVWLTLLDVGQGLSAVVRTAKHVLIYDAGPKSFTGFDAGRSIVIPYLRDRGIQQIDTMVISHGDNDHIGGANAILGQYVVKRLLSSVPSKLSNYHAQFCYAGQTWQWDGVRFHILSPPQGQVYRDNNSSCVLRITTSTGAVLLTGDIQREAENWLLKRGRDRLHAIILVAPHHGSATSSQKAFVAAVGAHYVLFPVGYYNRYGFPSPVVWQRYQRSGAALYKTSSDGAIFVHLMPLGQVKLTTMNQHQHYWQE